MILAWPLGRLWTALLQIPTDTGLTALTHVSLYHSLTSLHAACSRWSTAVQGLRNDPPGIRRNASAPYMTAFGTSSLAVFLIIRLFRCNSPHRPDPSKALGFSSTRRSITIPQLGTGTHSQKVTLLPLCIYTIITPHDPTIPPHRTHTAHACNRIE
jgi:hypothetical protein